MTDASAGFDALSPSAGPVTRGSFARVGLATAITAACGYAVLYLAARDLDPAGFSIFAVFWGAFGLVTGAANGLLQEAARECGRIAPTPESTRQLESSGRPGISPMRVAAGIGVAAAAAIACSSPRFMVGYVFAAARPLSVALLSAGLADSAARNAVGLARRFGRRWSRYGLLMVTDAVIRVAVALTTFLLGWGLVGFLWATVGGAVAWLLLLTVSRRSAHRGPITNAGYRFGLPAEASRSIAASNQCDSGDGAWFYSKRRPENSARRAEW